MAELLKGAHAWTEKDVATKAGLDSALRADPSDKSSLVALAMLFIEKGQLEQAEEMLKRAMIGDVRAREDAPQVLRKLGNASVALWRARSVAGEAADGWKVINLSVARKQHALDAIAFFDQALAYTENSASPAALYDSAVTREHEGSLPAALEGLSQIIARFPLFEGLNVIIFRAASVLKHLGDVEQAIQYFEYVMDSPPVSHGYGLLHVLALMYALYTAAQYTVKARRCRSKLRAVYVKAHPDMEEEVPPDNDWSVDRARPARASEVPPRATAFSHADFCPSRSARALFRRGDGGEFHAWPGLWLELARDCLERCDYCLAVAYLREVVARAPSVPVLTVMAEAYWLLGEAEPALRAAAEAHALDPLDEATNRHLVEWAPDVWRARLQQEEAARRDADEKVIEQRRIEGERMEHGRQVMRKVNLKAKRFALELWHRAFRHSSAATMIQKMMRGALARTRVQKLRLELAEHERKIKLMVRKMSRSLMTHHLQNWNARVKKLNAQRSMVAGPMIRRAQQRVLARTVALWRREVELALASRLQIRRAFENKMGYPLYSEPLRALGEFEAHRPYHEARVREVLESKTARV